MARPTSSPAIAAGAALPLMISSIAAAASSVVRSSRARILCRSGTNTSQLQKIPQDPPAFRRQDRFRMKLHAMHRVFAVTQPHDDAVFAGTCRDLEIGRQSSLL